MMGKTEALGTDIRAHGGYEGADDKPRPELAITILGGLSDLCAHQLELDDLIVYGGTVARIVELSVGEADDVVMFRLRDAIMPRKDVDIECPPHTLVTGFFGKGIGYHA